MGRKAQRKTAKTTTAVAALLLATLACGEPGGPDGTPVEPVVYETARFRIEDLSGRPPAELEALGARLEAEFGRVAALLSGFALPPIPITFRIEAGLGMPFVTLGANRMTQWSEAIRPQYFTHQLTHMFTRYQRTVFLEEGLAVWASEMLETGDLRPDPYRGQPTHAWVSLFEQYGSTINLFTALGADNLSHDFRGSSPDASAWQLFIEAGSFTRWLIDEHGFDRWLVFFATGSTASAIGLNTVETEQVWLGYATSQHPNPLACEAALGEVGPRETFWCARTRGQ
ncbi:MAG: hypothetical protein WD043_12135 [Gemmatimonadales bacterium]